MGLSQRRAETLTNSDKGAVACPSPSPVADDSTNLIFRFRRDNACQSIRLLTTDLNPTGVDNACRAGDSLRGPENLVHAIGRTDIEELQLAANFRYDWTGRWSGDVGWLRVGSFTLFKPRKASQSYVGQSGESQPSGN